MSVGSDDSFSLSGSAESDENEGGEGLKAPDKPLKAGNAVPSVRATSVTKTEKNDFAVQKGLNHGKEADKKESREKIVVIDRDVDITRGPPVTTESSAKKLVLQYMKIQNRPYSLIQVYENLHQRIPKTTLQRVLDQLTNPGGEQLDRLKVKEYGKAKIYYLDQVTTTE